MIAVSMKCAAVPGTVVMPARMCWLIACGVIVGLVGCIAFLLMVLFVVVLVEFVILQILPAENGMMYETRG